VGALRSLLGAFQFSGDEVEKKIRSLSGGERSRLVLARMLMYPPNLLVLARTTNEPPGFAHRKDMLIKALKDFEGTMIFVSHDRSFLRGLSTRVLELSGRRAAPVPRVLCRVRRAHRPRGAGHSFVRKAPLIYFRAIYHL